MRLDRPIGVWLLLWPSLWGITLASGGLRALDTASLLTMALFGFGALIMRGAGCVINDLWDRDLDKMVERTKGRPLASGDVSVKQALIFLATLLLIGLFILLQFNVTTILLGLLAVPFVIAYPLMKRITWWPQAFLGLTFNFGALMGWTAIMGTLAPAALVLYASGFFWTMSYDTIYAHQDKEDDVFAGIKSTALIFKDKSKYWIGGFFLMSYALLCTGVVMALGLSSWSALLILPALQLVWQIKTWEPDNHASSLKIFKSNRYYGLLVFLALL